MINSLVDKNGILTTENAVKHNISKQELYKFIKENGLEKVAHGIYAEKDSWVDPLMLAVKRCPHAVVSHDEALYHYGLIDREPLKPTITVYSGYNKTNLKESGYKVYSVKKELVELGKTSAIDQFGNTVPIYDMERTICDLIRSRSHFEIQDFNTAIKSYARKTDKNIGRLFEYARQFGIDKLFADIFGGATLMGLTEAQIRGRLKNEASKNQADARNLMRIYMMERFLERLANSPYKDNFIIKGGILVTSMVGLSIFNNANMPTISIEHLTKIFLRHIFICHPISVRNGQYVIFA